MLAVPARPDSAGGVRLGAGADDLSALHGVDLTAVATAARHTGRVGQTVSHVLPDGGLLVIVGVGDAGPAELRSAGAALARTVRGRELVATTLGVGAEPVGVEALVEGLLLASFTLTWRSAGPEKEPVRQVVLCGTTSPDADRAVARGRVLARAGWDSREVSSWPSREKSPQWLAERAAAVAAVTGLGLRVRDETALAAGGFGGLLGVGQGSPRPPRLVELSYEPSHRSRRRRRVPHVVLVGKGITFDTGGLWLKSRDGMATMKRDVTGGAVVLAVLAALPALDVGLRVTGLVAAAENSIGGSAQRPGDVVRHPDGRTSEVLNTDAEGRLVLADALAYAAAELRPDALVDVATLTGAAKVALGRTLGGLFADDDALAASLLAAGRAAGEPLWRLPLVDDYRREIASDVADARNMGEVGGAGAVTAALFLQPFTGGVAWAHLDLASVGDAAKDADVWTEGPTGFGARALLHWLAGDDPLAGARSR